MPKPSASPPIAPLLWTALCSSALLMLGVALFVPEELGPIDPLLLYALFAAAVPAAAASFIVPQLLRKQAFRAIELGGSPDGAQRAMGMQAFSVKSALGPEESARVRSKVLLAAQAPFILSLGLSEAVLVFGLVLRFLGASILQAAPLLALGCLLILARFPRPEATLRAFETQRGVRLLR